jgi:hypothetical protein
MPKNISKTVGVCLVSYTALQAYAGGGNAVSSEAMTVGKAATAIVNSVERSQSLFGKKATAISRLFALANECAEQGWDGEGADAINPIAVINAESFLRAMPENFPLPEFAAEPDGGVSLDWIKSRNCLFSLSIGSNNRLAFAWLDGADKGHAVARFDGRQVPNRILEGITAIVNHGDASIWAA